MSIETKSLVISDNIDLGVTFTSPAIDVTQYGMYAVQVVFVGGTCAGDIRIQVSNDGTNFTDDTDSIIAYDNTTGSHIINVIAKAYKSMRVKITNASGTASVGKIVFQGVING